MIGGLFDTTAIFRGDWLQHMAAEGRIALIGDAAHRKSNHYYKLAESMLRYFTRSHWWGLWYVRSPENVTLRRLTWCFTGAGAALAFNDANALALAITHVRDHYPDLDRANQIATALSIYDETRRHFMLRVFDQLKKDVIAAGEIRAAPTDEEKIAKWKENHHSTRWIKEHNVRTEFEKVVTANGYHR